MIQHFISAFQAPTAIFFKLRPSILFIASIQVTGTRVGKESGETSWVERREAPYSWETPWEWRQCGTRGAGKTARGTGGSGCSSSVVVAKFQPPFFEMSVYLTFFGVVILVISKLPCLFYFFQSCDKPIWVTSFLSKFHRDHHMCDRFFSV